MPVGAKRHTEHGGVVAAQGLAQRAPVGRNTVYHDRRVGEVPQPDGVIGAAGGQGVPVGTERHTGHGAGVAAQGLAQRTRVGRVGEVPQPDGVTGVAGGQGVPVGTERHT